MAESSLSDWVQAAMSIVQAGAACWGIYYIIQSFRQGNKNLELQISSLRNASRPRLVIVGHEPEAYRNIDQFTDVVAFTIANKEASQLSLIPAKQQKFKFFKSNGEEFDRWYIDHVPVGTVITFAYDYNFSDPPPESSVNAIAELMLTFVDENGYSYEQSIQGGIRNGMLQSAILLDIVYLQSTT